MWNLRTRLCSIVGRLSARRIFTATHTGPCADLQSCYNAERINLQTRSFSNKAVDPLTCIFRRATTSVPVHGKPSLKMLALEVCDVQGRRAVHSSLYRTGVRERILMWRLLYLRMRSLRVFHVFLNRKSHPIILSLENSFLSVNFKASGHGQNIYSLYLRPNRYNKIHESFQNVFQCQAHHYRRLAAGFHHFSSV